MPVVFSSLPFVLLFMPLFFGCYFLVPKRLKNFVLLVGSLAFYFVGTIDTPYHFILFIGSILMDWTAGIGIEKYPRRKRLLLILSITLHLLYLCTFKYADFLLGELGVSAVGIALPIGISFYTFQGISYIADVYRGKIKSEKSLLDFAVYIAMFPQLIAGPIVTYEAVADRLRDRRVDRRGVLHGLAVFVFGLGLKVLLANPVGKLWSQACAIGFESLSTPLAWMAVLAFSFQIYFDFFGYSLMAMGLGEMLGFRLPANFDHPYTSCSMTEFWRRWHITLGSWFREYVYIPLGGNRRGKCRTVLNLLIVWLLTGMWHGAGYTYLLWGLSLFFLIFCEKFFIGGFLQRHRAVGHLYMLLLIPLTWAVFAAEDVSQLGVLLSRLFPLFGQETLYPHDWLKYLTQYAPFLAAGALLSVKFPYRLLKRIKNKAIIALLLSAVAAGSLYCMYRGFDDPFLYFRF